MSDSRLSTGWLPLRASRAVSRLLMIAGLSAWACDALAQPGQLDPSFDGDGRVTTAFSGRDRAWAIAIQADGKIVVAGETFATSDPASGDFAVARYNADGTLDATFGTNGRVTTDFAGLQDRATAVALHGDGRIVVAGWSLAPAYMSSGPLALVRYLSDGSLDATFGTAGRVTLASVSNCYPSPGSCPPQTVLVYGAAGVAIDTRGRVVAGAQVAFPGSEQYLAVARFDDAGRLDPTFNHGRDHGRETPGVSTEIFLSEQTFGVALQPDGRIVVAGNQNGLEQVVLSRLLDSGPLDTTFGTSGFATVAPPSHVIAEYGRALSLQPDGKIIVAGGVIRANFGSVFREAVHIARYSSDGTPDTTFGSGGRTETWMPGVGMSADAVAVEASGNIIIAGCIEQGGPSFGQCQFSGPSTATNFLLARYGPTGVLDPTFGSPFAGIDIAGHWDTAAGIAIQSEGRIVAAGGASLDGSVQKRFAVVRVLGGTVNCTPALLPASRSTSRAAGSGTIEVGLPAGCPWTAASNAPWIVVSAGSSGTGRGAVTYVFGENITTSQRVGTLTIAGITFTLTQAPVILPVIQTQPVDRAVVAGQTVQFSVAAFGDPTPVYRWQISSIGSVWVDVPDGAPYVGAASATLSVSPTTLALNGFRFRALASNTFGSATSLAATLTVSPPIGCAYAVDVAEVVVPGNGGSGGIELATGPTCTWTATGTEHWLAISPTTGTGSRRIDYSIAASGLAAERTAALLVGGRAVGFRQLAGGIAAPVLAPAIITRPNVSFSWTPPPAGPLPTSYTLVASLTTGGPPVASLPLGTQTSLTVAAPDGTFYVRIIATVNGSPVYSNEIQVVVAPPSAPSAPRGLSATGAGSVITFTWQAPSGSVVTNYVLEAGSGPGLSNLARLALGNVTTFVTPPVPNGSYYVRVRGQNASGTGPGSSEVRVVVGPPPPSAPALTGSSSAGGAVTLSWSVPASGAAVTGYQLHAGSTPGASNIAVINFPVTQTTLPTGGVPPGTYYVRVVAASAQGLGDFSNEITVVVP